MQRRPVVPGTTFVRWSCIALLWLLALWNGWECRALVSDGAVFLIQIVHAGWFHNFLARHYAASATQLPLVIGIHLGITDLHALARLLSLGTSILPAALYSLALMRAKDDMVLLAAVIAALAMVFLPGSFFIVGEFHAACALAIAAATLLATSNRPSMNDAVVLAVLATFALRTYEFFLVLGPLLAAMVAWAASRAALPSDRPYPNATIGLLCLAGLAPVLGVVALLGPYPMLLLVGALLAACLAFSWWRPQAGRSLAWFLYWIAAALFLDSAVVSVASIAGNGGGKLIEYVMQTSDVIWLNASLVLTVLTAAILVSVALFSPPQLLGHRLYVVAGIPIAALAMAPFLAPRMLSSHPFGSAHSLATMHFAARIACGALTAAIVVFLWIVGSGSMRTRSVFCVLGKPAAARRLLAFSFAMFLSALPSDVLTTISWASAMEALRGTVQSRDGPLNIADLPASAADFLGDPDWNEYFHPLSIVLRSNPGSGIVVMPDFSLPELDARYVWRK